MRLIDLYDRSLEILRRSGTGDAGVDAAVLFKHFLGVSRRDLFPDRDARLTWKQTRAIRKAVSERARSKPVAYIVGYKDFYRDRIAVGPGTLIPRADTEHLVYAAEAESRPFANVLEIGAGSGAVSIALARLFPGAQVTGFDIDVSAAEANASRLGVPNVRFSKLDIFSVPDGTVLPCRYDLIVSNPPYLSKEDMRNLPKEVKMYEPWSALFGGYDGLDFYRKISALAGGFLTPGGVLIFEVDYKWERVERIVGEAGLVFTGIKKDYNNLERVLIAKNNE